MCGKYDQYAVVPFGIVVLIVYFSLIFWKIRAARRDCVDPSYYSNFAYTFLSQWSNLGIGNLSSASPVREEDRESMMRHVSELFAWTLVLFVFAGIGIVSIGPMCRL